MIADAGGAQCQTTEHHCITCSDEGTPMWVMSAEGAQAWCVDEGGGTHEVAIDLIGDVTRGDEVLVHAGVAIRHLRLGR